MDETKKRIYVDEYAYNAIMSVYRRYRMYYRSLDEFLLDLIDNYLMSDPQYMEELIERLSGKRKDVKIFIHPYIDIPLDVSEDSSSGSGS